MEWGRGLHWSSVQEQRHKGVEGAARDFWPECLLSRNKADIGREAILRVSRCRRAVSMEAVSQPCFLPNWQSGAWHLICTFPLPPAPAPAAPGKGRSHYREGGWKRTDPWGLLYVHLAPGRNEGAREVESPKYADSIFSVPHLVSFHLHSNVW